MKSLKNYKNEMQGKYFNLEESKSLLAKILNEYSNDELNEESNLKQKSHGLFLEHYFNRWNEFFEKIPSSITKHSMHYTQTFILFGTNIWERILFGSDINWSGNEIDIIKSKTDSYFDLPEKVVYWFMSANYGNFDRMTKFEKTDPERKLLYKLAWILYKEKIKENSLSKYTYIRALEDANNKYKIIDLENVDFYNLEQGFKLWRKNNLNKKEND